MKYRLQRSLLAIFLFAVNAIGLTPASAQEIKLTNVKCGDIVEAELTPTQKGMGFRLQVEAGTTLIGSVAPVGSTFNPYIVFLDSGGQDIKRQNKTKAGEMEDFADLVIGSSNPELWIYGVGLGVENENIGNDSWYGLGRGYTFRDKITGDSRYIGYIGAFVISLGCKLRDGKIINPGDTATQPEEKPVFSGKGFPGLDPVDFETAVTVELSGDGKGKGSIRPNADTILGFTFNGTKDSKMSLDFVRTAGNLNLGLVVLSEDNKVVFQASLTTVDSVSARFTLPSDGVYTVGVFKVDLLTPSDAQNTSYELTVKPQ